MPNGNDPLTIFSIEDLERLIPVPRRQLTETGVTPFQRPALVQTARGFADIIEAIREGRTRRRFGEAAATRQQTLADILTGGGAAGAPQPPPQVPPEGAAEGLPVLRQEAPLQPSPALGPAPGGAPGLPEGTGAAILASQGLGGGLPIGGQPTTIGALGQPLAEQPIGQLPPQQEPQAAGLEQLPVGAFERGLGRRGGVVGRFFNRLTRPPDVRGTEIPRNLPQLIAEAYARSPAEGETVRAAASALLGTPIAQPRIRKPAKAAEPFSPTGKLIADMERAVKGGILSRERADEIIGIAAGTEVGAPVKARLRSTEEIATEKRALDREQGTLNRSLKKLGLSDEANRANDKRVFDAKQAGLKAWDVRSKGRRLTPKLKLERDIAGREAEVSELQKIISTEIGRGEADVLGITTQPSAARALAGAGAQPTRTTQPRGLLDVLLAAVEEE